MKQHIRNTLTIRKGIGYESSYFDRVSQLATSYASEQDINLVVWDLRGVGDSRILELASDSEEFIGNLANRLRNNGLGIIVETDKHAMDLEHPERTN